MKQRIILILYISLIISISTIKISIRQSTMDNSSDLNNQPNTNADNDIGTYQSNDISEGINENEEENKVNDEAQPLLESQEAGQNIGARESEDNMTNQEISYDDRQNLQGSEHEEQNEDETDEEELNAQGSESVNQDNQETEVIEDEEDPSNLENVGDDSNLNQDNQSNDHETIYVEDDGTLGNNTEDHILVESPQEEFTYFDPSRYEIINTSSDWCWQPCYCSHPDLNSSSEKPELCWCWSPCWCWYYGAQIPEGMQLSAEETGSSALPPVPDVPAPNVTPSF